MGHTAFCNLPPNMHQTSDDSEKAMALFEKFRKEKGDLFEESTSALGGKAQRGVHLAYYLRMGISAFFVAVFAFTAYYMVSQHEDDPRLFVALGSFAFIAFGAYREAKRTKRYRNSYALKGIVTDKIEQFQGNIPLHIVELSQKKKIRITEADYRALLRGDIIEVNVVDPGDPSLPLSIRKIGSIADGGFQENASHKPGPRSTGADRYSLRNFFGRFALALLLVNLIFLLTYGVRTVAANQYVERYTLFYWVLAAVSLGTVGYFMVYPLFLLRVPKAMTRAGAMIYFFVGALVSTTPLLLAMDYFLVTVKMVESPEALGPGDQRFFMFKKFHLHRELQYDSVYYRYDRGARGQSPRDEFNYFVVIPMSESAGDSVFNVLLYRSVSVSQEAGKYIIEDGLRELYTKEHQHTKVFPFDSITYFNRSEGGTLTKSTLGQLAGDRIAELPFQSQASALLLEPRTDNPVDEGPSFLLFYLIVFAVFMLFSIAFS